MKGNLITMLIGVCTLLLGYFLLEKSSDMVTKSKYDLAQNLCKESSRTIGELSETYEELSVSKLKFNTFFYKYQVNGNTYHAKEIIADINDVELTADIWFNPENPRLYLLKDPCDIQELYDKEKMIGNERRYFYSGLIAGLLGFFITLGGFRSFVIGLIFKK